MFVFPMCLRWKNELRMMTSTRLLIALRFGLCDNIVFSNPGSSLCLFGLMDDEEFLSKDFGSI